MPLTRRHLVLVCTVVAASLAASGAGRRAPIELPFSGSFTGQLALLPPFSEGSVDRCNANATPDGMFPGHFLTLTDAGAGEFTHLGRTVVESTSCLAPDSPFNVQGQGTLHAANGDRVEITFENLTLPTDDPDVLQVTGTETIVGGTGRFASASGEQSCAFTVRLSTGIIAGGCHGVIVY